MHGTVGRAADLPAFGRAVPFRFANTVRQAFSYAPAIANNLHTGYKQP